jgi:signal transduction histidine kinase/ActR/RegA family two-component response regulator
MQFLRPRNLNEALSRLLVVVLAPMLFGTLALLVFQASQDRREAQTRMSTLAHTLAQVMDAEVESARAKLEVLAASGLVDRGDFRQLRDFAAEALRSTPGSVVELVGPDGRVVFNTMVPWGDALPNLWSIGDRNEEVEWEGRKLPLGSGNLSRLAMESGMPAHSDLYYGVQVNRPALSVAMPVFRDGKPRFAIILTYPPQTLQARIRAAMQGSGTRALVVDRRGLVVAATGATGETMGDKAFAVETAAKPAGLFQVTSSEGTPLTGAFVTSRANGFSIRVAQPRISDILPSRATTLAWTALLMVAIGTSLLLASIFSRRLARPLAELGEDVRAGREPPPGREAGIEEIDLLAQALRDGARAERERAEESTRRRIAESQEALLRQADRQKDEFLATLAHELRNPLAPIRNSAELIRLRKATDPVIDRARTVIERQTLHLTHLVDDLLDVSRVTLGRVQLRREPVNLVEVAASALDAVSGAAAESGVHVVRRFAATPAWVSGDVTRLAQCVANVLNNAIKFTPHGGQVEMTLLRSNDRAVLSVRDSGVGISPDNLKRVFELFVQERHSGQGGNSGLGIGLALTRRLLELHGGSIAASSEGPGCGSTFTITLPLAEVPGQERVRKPAGTVRRQVDANLLVVDDNPDAAETLAELLLAEGYHVAVAHDGESAVRHVAQRRPDAVLLDIGLPDIDGYEACRRIRLQAADGHPPLLVAVTGWGQAADRERAQDAGFDAHLTKPVDPADLLRLLQERLATLA